MSILQDHAWLCKYTPSTGNLITQFYIPALSCAVRYDRTTGYFCAESLAAASTGVEELVRNGGHMRLVVGCTLEEDEVRAIQRGESLRQTLDAKLLQIPFTATSQPVHNALELLAWMVANGFLQVKVAVPCHQKTRQPCAGCGIFHEKAGIIEDKTGDRLVFNGSLNETLAGWTSNNWDSFHVYCSWRDDAEHLDADETSFQKLWADKEPSALIFELGEAVRKNLLQFLPAENNLPVRLAHQENTSCSAPEPELQQEPEVPSVVEDIFTQTWEFIRKAPTLPDGGELVGEATAAITPWPHQVQAFTRMYQHWPPRLLIADEVGLGKTIQAGLVIRQAWLSGKAKRILILAPKAVLHQWQLELREKFNINVPIFEGGCLFWYPSPALQGKNKLPVDDTAWHQQPILLASSHLMRRKDRTRQLLEDATPWDLVILDEAHHARRKGGIKDAAHNVPNQLLRLMRELKDKTQGLVLLTATPMQVHPLEVWDLLSLLGLPTEWTADAFLKFFECAAAPAPDEGILVFMSRLFRAIEHHFHQISFEEALRREPEHRSIRTKKVLKALREGAVTPLKMLNIEERRYALRLMQSWSPTRQLISRNTRELLRQYHKAGKLSANIATREVVDYLVELSPAERTLYEAVEDYIATTYNRASKDERIAVGFVMTIYRRRLASSFFALARTLQNRQEALGSENAIKLGSLEDFPDDELAEDELDSDAASDLERKALQQEEAEDITILRQAIQKLPTDSKARSLLEVITTLQAQGYKQVIIFTQYTDSLDFLRKVIANEQGAKSILCFSGRGGERWNSGQWESISREKTKELFRAGAAEILLCTDAAAEGLNFQFCGALVNYDMPWNPMKVEQRIGRIDRLGQAFSKIRIINLMYADTVETDVYSALRERIGLFGTFVGKLQPILSKLPKAFGELAVQSRAQQEAARDQAIAAIATEIQEQERTGFDLDEITSAELEMPPRPIPAYDLAWLNTVLTNSALLPPGYEALPLAGGKDFKYLIPGSPAPIRVTTDPAFYEAHAESVELWSPGNPAFPPLS